MENEIVKQKNSKGIIIALIILLVCALGYIVYDKFMTKDTVKTNDNQTTQITDSTKADSTTQVTNTTSVSTESLYKDFINNLKTRKYGEKVSFSGIDGVANGYKHFILGIDNKLYVESNNTNDAKIPGTMGSDGMQYNGIYTGIENAVRIFKTYHSNSGEGASYGLLVLKEDGNIYIMKNPGSTDYKLEQLENKNIVSAYDGISPYGTTYVVDISGNSYEIK